jgi:hypothetical protein
MASDDFDLFIRDNPGIDIEDDDDDIVTPSPDYINFVFPIGISTRHLRLLNAAAFIIHFVQASIFLTIDNGFSIPVRAFYVTNISGGTEVEVVTLFDIRTAYAIAVMFFLSAFFHLLVIVPGVYPVYARGVVDTHNYFRWVEYSMTSSIMIVLIAQFVGITNVSALISMFCLNATMLMFGLIQERYEFPGTGGLIPFACGCFAGVVPWIIILLDMIGPRVVVHEDTSGFVYAMVSSIFATFNCFGIVQYLQYRPAWKFGDYSVGEMTYLALSIVAKSALAWQVYVAVLS